MLKMDSTSLICCLLFLWVDLSIGVEVACSNDTNVNAVCECTKRTVDCANRGLNEWPVGIPVNTQTLYMNNNNLKEIDEDALSKLHELFTINVNNNLLSKLPSLPKTIGNIHADKNLLTDISTVFNDLPILHILSLTNNKITILRNTTFQGSTVITNLYLSSNDINIIEPFTFANNSKLAYLRIKNNKKLQMLGENAFAFTNGGSVSISISPSVVELSTGTFKLSTGSSIHLSKNKLRSIPSKAFQGGDILVLDLVNNNISFIHKDAFVAMDSIFSLLLAYNRLTEIPIFRGYIYGTLDLSWNSLTSLEDRKIPAVKNLFLGKNNIQSISTKIFANMSSLQTLFLVHNNITFIEDGAFNETNLYFLFLYGNKISNITYKTLETQNTTLEYIYLFDNPIMQIEENALSHMIEKGTVYLNCCGLKSIPSNIGKLINIVCVKEGTEIEIKGIDGELLRIIGREIGLTCNSTTSKCSPCKEGTYRLYDSTECAKCPPGGFYQDKRGVNEKGGYKESCQRCPLGSFSNNAGAASIAGCQTCPSGTKTNNISNLNACYCLDNFHRTDRFGPCMPCSEGINCEGGYQNLTKGYWWSWDFNGDCRVGEEQNKNNCLLAYTTFVTKLKNDLFPITNPNQLKDAVYKGPLPKVYACPLGEKSCNIGLKFNDTCVEGYTGWLCAACSNGHYELFNECHKCQGAAVTVIIFVSVAFAIIGMILLLWRMQERNVDRRQTSLDSFVTYLKISINFYQVLGILSEVTEIHWPKNFEYAGQILQYFDVIRYISMLSPRCLHDSWNAYSSLHIAMATPLVILLTMSTIYFICYIWNKCHGAVTESCIRDRCIVISMLLLYLTYANTCADILAVGPWSIRVFNVTADDDGKINKTVLTSDYSIDMDQNGGSTYQTNKTLVYVALIYIIGFPLVIVLMLYYKNVRFDQHEENQRKGWMNGVRFFCGQYKHTFWFWESFELYNKALLALIANLKDDVSSSLSYSLFFTVIFIVLHLYLEPMKEKSEQRFQLLTLVFIVVNLSIGAIVNLDQSFNEDDVIGLLHKITPVILIMLNVSIMLVVTVDFLKKLKTDCCHQERGVLLLQIDDDPDESQIEENNIII
ncbi:uncharacterized protein [Antedon mediterranea]|uniref:uncharacterized protein n=1 Tax=Antedon mediterranea TaxID=105859 RepID=UPI003AF85D42